MWGAESFSGLCPLPQIEASQNGGGGGGEQRAGVSRDQRSRVGLFNLAEAISTLGNILTGLISQS